MKTTATATDLSPLMPHPQGGPIARIVTVTPEYALRLLERNSRNRNVSTRNLDILVRALTNGEWQLNGEAIKIDADGYILDGQHRLRAIVATGIPIRTFIIENLEPETQDTMDTGKSRGLADILAIRGEKNSTSLAAAIRRVFLYKRYGLKQATVGSNATTNHECLTFYAQHPGIADLYSPAVRVAKAAKLPASLGSLLMFAFSEIDADDAQFFFDRLTTGEDLGAGHPIQVLRETLRRLYDSKGATNQTYLAALTIKAWNKWRAGETISLLKFTPGGSTPEQFPEPR